MASSKLARGGSILFQDLKKIKMAFERTFDDSIENQLFTLMLEDL